MPEKETLENRAEEDKREGKAPSTQAGEFVKEEMDHIRTSRQHKQAIAIGLSKARSRHRKKAAHRRRRASRLESAYRKGTKSSARKKPSRKRSRATAKML